MKFTVGNALGHLTKITLLGASHITKGIGTISNKVIKDEVKQKEFQEKTNRISESIIENSDGISDKVCSSVDNVIIKSGDIAGNISKKIATQMNASEETIQKADKIGKTVGKVAVGGGIGIATSAALISGLATSGTAGAAATTSGLAALGGGSIAAEGAGMAGGIAIASAITATTAVAANNTTKEEDSKSPEDKTENEDSDKIS